jgi:hypothetical protein
MGNLIEASNNLPIPVVTRVFFFIGITSLELAGRF